MSYLMLVDVLMLQVYEGDFVWVIVDVCYQLVDIVYGDLVYEKGYIFGVVFMYCDCDLVGVMIGLNGCYLLFDFDCLVL